MLRRGIIIVALLGSSNACAEFALTGFTCLLSGGIGCTQIIPDSGSPPPFDIVSTMEIADCSKVTGIAVGLRITHPWPLDLRVTLESPDGTRRHVLDRPACGQPDILTMLSDSAGVSTRDGCANQGIGLYGPLLPDESLAPFVGGNGSGVWSLTVKDEDIGQQGGLWDWSLDLVCDVEDLIFKDGFEGFVAP